MHRSLRLLLVAALLAALPLAAQTPLRAGQVVRGTLDASDARMPNGEHYDRYVLQGRPGQRLIVYMRSRALDPFLSWGRAADGAWTEARSDNDGGGQVWNARLLVTLPADGGHELRATAFLHPRRDSAAAQAGPKTGPYEITVAELVFPTPRPIGTGESVRGELTDADFADIDGPEDHYVFTGPFGRQVTFLVWSDDFEPGVGIGFWHDGKFHVNPSDRGLQGLVEAAVREDMTRADSVEVVVRGVTGLGEFRRGGYTLRVVQGAVEPRDARLTGNPSVEQDRTGDALGQQPLPREEMVGVHAGAVRAGADTRGELSGVAPTPGVRKLYREYEYTAAAGERLVVTVTSGAMDAFVAVGTGRGEGFRSLAADDDGAGGTNARLEYVVPAAGLLTIRVTTAFTDQSGPFVLRVESRR